MAKKLLFLTLTVFTLSIAAADRAPVQLEKPVQFSEIINVEFKAPPTETQINLLRKVKFVISVTRLTPLKDREGYFPRIYEVRVDKAALNSQSFPELKADLIKTGVIKKLWESHYFVNYSIIPSTTTTPASNDTLFNYQWNVHNNGQKILNDITDIKPEVFDGKDGIDIGWIKIRDQLNTIVKRDVKVAVIDSGSTTDHPDLKNSFAKNMIECTPQGTVNVAAKEDKDNNGYIGDCMGWSFATPENLPQGKNIVDDDFGHGTHVGSIMAAEGNNKNGIAGISNKIKLIPIKVYRDDRSQPGRMNTLSGFISNITKAVAYAIAIKAEVINISLGWPESADSDDVRKVFELAMKNNITIVAAAGNDSHNALVYPCAYRGVICVGSVNNNGTVSDFSNYGGHVDVLAPGNEILAAIPMKIKSEFSIAGYDVKWGTSQAAPHVAAIAALLKGAKESISSDEIYARLLSTSVPIPSDEKYFLGGLVQLDKALTEPLKPAVRPIFKNLTQIPYNYLGQNEGQFKLSLPIRSYGAAAHNIEIAVSSDLPNVRFDNPVLRYPTLDSGEEVILNLNGSLRDLKSESNLTLNVQIKGTGIFGNYKHNLFLVRTLASDPEIRAYPILTTHTTLNSHRVSNLVTVQTYNNRYATPEYYLKECIVEKPTCKGQALTIYKNNGSQYVENANLKLENAQNIYLFIKTDLNYDGRPDYLLHYKTFDNVLYYAYLNDNLQPLFGNTQNSVFKLSKPVTAWLKFKLDLNDRDDSYESLRFMPYTVPGLGAIAAPVFMAEGYIPEIDQNPDPFERVISLRRRLYYYEPKLTPDGAEFINRTWISYKTIKKVRVELGLRDRDYLDFAFIFPQTPQDVINGKIELGIAWSKNDELYYSKLSMDRNSFYKREYTISPMDVGGTNLVGHVAKTAINLDGVIPTQGSLTLDTLYSFTSSRVAYIDNADRAFMSQSVNLSPINEKHKFPGRYFIRGYEKGNATYTFVMTFENLIMKYQSGSVEKQVERPITKSSSLPTYSFGENIEALTAGTGNQKIPAIYVDATSINAQHAYVLIPQNDQLIVPLDLNIQIPPNCISKNPVPWGQQGESAFSIICQDSKDTFSIRHMPIR